MATQLKENTHADDDAFRTEVREFLAENFPEELKANLLAGLKIPTNETPLHTKWRESYRCSGLGTPNWTCNGLVPVACLSLCHLSFESQGAYAAQI
ncbi:acyl-CoA dehydrogenase [Sphingorhabdus sp. SMR4y]|nr:acyl-CoA dehydrogenase [Sphingorhabdus sp. SMR4y]VWX62398.1 Acyl-CoA dehydrogenase [Sphingorhabdus sp. 109]